MNLLLAVLIVAATPAAPIDTRPPDAVEVFYCDFEERADRDLDGWPDGWTRKRGSDFPAYLPVRIVDAETHSGQYALRIGLNGGAACISSPPIEVGSVFSYALEGCLKTEGLRNDRAFITIQFLNAKGAVLQTFTSEKFQDARDWRKVRLGPLVADSEQVRSAVISLHLEPTGDIADLRGAAWFDDLWLGRLPRMSLHTGKVDNVYTDASQIDIQCKVSGIFDHNPVMKCELVNVYGQPVGEPTVRQLETKAATLRTDRAPILANQPAEQDKGFVGSLHWKPVVPGPGFYRARVTLAGSAEKVLERQLTLAVIDAAPHRAGGEFGWTLPQADHPLSYQLLAQLLPEMGLGWAKYPVWLNGKQVDKLDELVDFAERMRLAGIESVGILADPPAEERAQFGDTPDLTAAVIFSTTPDMWYKSLEHATTRLSMQVHWWQMGADDDTSFVGDPHLRERVAAVKKELEQFGQAAHMGLPWKMLFEVPQSKRSPWDFLSLTAEPALTAQELVSYLPASEAQRPQRWLVLEPLGQSDYTLADRASDLVHRMVAAKRLGAEAIFIPNPFDDERGLMNADGTPGELLLPWRTAALALAGAKYMGSLVLPNGSQNCIFSRGDEMTMVVWNASEVEERVFLGDGARQIDLWGRSTLPKQVEHDYLLRVGPVPSIVVGLSDPIVRWIMDLSFDKRRLPSVFGTNHANALSMKNYFPQGTSGQVRLHTPEVWQTAPRLMNLKLAAGEELHEPFTIRLPFDATNGRYPVRVDFDITADREYHFSVYRELEVGLGDVVIDMTSHLNAQGDLEVEQHVINNTDQLLSFKCSLFAPDRRRLVSQVTRLGTERDTKRYRFPNGQELIGKTLSLRAEEIGGDRTFNFRFIAKE